MWREWGRRREYLGYVIVVNQQITGMSDGSDISDFSSCVHDARIIGREGWEEGSIQSLPYWTEWKWLIIEVFLWSNEWWRFPVQVNVLICVKVFFSTSLLYYAYYFHIHITPSASTSVLPALFPSSRISLCASHADFVNELRQSISHLAGVFGRAAYTSARATRTRINFSRDNGNGPISFAFRCFPL